MGMFDYIKCEAKLPDIGFDLPRNAEFQTKSLNKYMDMYIIRENGKLEKETREYEDHPTEVEIFAGKEFPKRVLISTEYKDMEHHGDVHFYSSFRIIDEPVSVHLRFKARFTEGYLSRIETIEIAERDAPKLVEMNGQLVEESEGIAGVKIIHLAPQQIAVRV